MAVGVLEAAEALHRAKFTLLAVGHDWTRSQEYMFVPVGTAVIETAIASVVAVPVAAVVIVAPHAPEAIAAVVPAEVPEAIVTVIVPEDGNVAVLLIPVPPLVLARSPVT